MRLARRILLLFLIASAGFGAWFLWRPAHDEHATRLVDVRSVKFEKLPLERRKVEVGNDTQGWWWAKLAQLRIVGVAPCSREAEAFVETDDGAVHLLSFAHGEMLRLIPPTDQRHSTAPPALTCSPGGAFFTHAIRGRLELIDKFKRTRASQVFNVWRLDAPPKQLGFIPKYNCNASSLAFSPDGKRLAIGSELFTINGFRYALPSTINIWNLNDAKSWQPNELPENGRDEQPERSLRWESGPIKDAFSVRSLAWSPDGTLLAAIGTPHFQGMYYRETLRDPKEREYDLRERINRFHARRVAMSKDQKKKDDDRVDDAQWRSYILCCWHADTGELVKEWNSEKSEQMRDFRVAFVAGRPEPRVAYKGLNGFVVEDLDVATDQPRRRTLGESVTLATFVGTDAAILLVRDGAVELQNSAGEITSQRDLKSLFGNISEWRDSVSGDRRAVALWHESGVILYRTRP